MPVETGTLAEHHRRCDALFAAARASARLNELREALIEHFGYEEKHVFPLYEQASGRDGACDWLCAQHDDMRGMLYLLGAISPEDQRERFQAELAALQAAFQAHAADEEARMYPLFEKLLAR